VMLKAKQNSFLKWFMGIVLLIVALCSFMATAFADVIITCDDCGADFATSMFKKATTTTVAYGIDYIPGIGSQLWTNGNGKYCSVSNNHADFSEGKGEKDLCAACVEKRVAAYKASLTLNATVPASLPIHVGEDGKVTTASNASITNNGSKPIVISSINIAANSGWTVQSKVDATNAKAGSKVIAIGFNNSWVTPDSGNASGSINTSDFGKISASGTLNLAYDAVIPVAAAGGSTDETAATATIVVAFPEPPTLAAGPGWYKSSENRNTITKITLMDSYTPKTTADETWAADVNGTGDITCYRTGTEIIIAGNGTGKILANANSRFLFSHSSANSTFKELTSIKNLALLDTANVTDMGYMFYNCSGLTSLDVSNFDTANVTNMHSMFRSCSGLTSLDVSNFDTANVANMRSMFYECRSVTNLDVSNWNTSNVTNMSNMFYYCGSVRNLDVSNWNTSNVTNMSWMFAYCTGVTNIYVGDNWNTDKVTSSEYMFSNCKKLPNYNNSKVDKTAATFTTNGGYLTHKAATKSLKLNVDQSGTVNGYTEQSAA
jgi:surface protein